MSSGLNSIRAIRLAEGEPSNGVVGHKGSAVRRLEDNKGPGKYASDAKKFHQYTSLGVAGG